MNSKIVIQRAALIFVALFLIAGALIIALDWKEMRQVIGQVNWLLLAPSFLFTALSYICLSISLAIVFRVFGIKQDFKYLLRVGFVSNVASYLMNVGGATGVSMQYLLLKRRGLATEDILAPSLFQLYFSGLMLIVLLPISLLYILFSRQLSSGAITSLLSNRLIDELMFIIPLYTGITECGSHSMPVVRVPPDRLDKRQSCLSIEDRTCVCIALSL
jgi:uncharacterized membrane protein YbhN (UPF0104 family)